MLFKRFGLEFLIIVGAVLALSIFAADYRTFLTQHYDNPKVTCTKLL